MNNELMAMVTFLERDRGVSREIIIQAIESALQQSARRSLDVSPKLRVCVDRRTFQVKAYDTLTVSDTDVSPGSISVRQAQRYKKGAKEGDSFEVEIPASKLGRIGAASARQMILQKIREAERKSVYDEYKDRIGDIVSGTVKQIDWRDIYVDLGRFDALLPAKERIPTEEFSSGDHIRAIVHRVVQGSNGPAVVLSRASADFVKTLFRLEVSEISDGIVEIMGIARDPGFRTKLAVKTLDDKVDPVGACVGLRGVRVRNIIRELNGEKIDIVRWHQDIKQFVIQALQPAKLATIEISKNATKTILVTVAPDQLSLAIGKRGQNVRLTSKLTGWRVSIQKAAGEETFAEQRETAIQNLAEVLQVEENIAAVLVNNGFLTPDGIMASDVQYMTQTTGLDEAVVQKIFDAAASCVGDLPLAESEDEPSADEVYDGNEAE